MSKLAIYTIMIGDLPLFKLVEQLFLRYAEAVGADLIVCREAKHSKGIEAGANNSIICCLEKLEIASLLEDYDRVLYLDADVLIQPNARNIFSCFPDQSKTYMFNEGAFQSREGCIDEILAVFGDAGLKQVWPMYRGQYQYFNAGVMLFSKASKALFDAFDRERVQAILSVDLFEQTYFNYLIVKEGLVVEDFDYRFNRMDMIGGHFRKLRSDFIHYAGAGFTSDYARRNELMKDDILTLYMPEFKGSLWMKKPLSYYQWRKRLYACYWPISIPSLNYF